MQAWPRNYFEQRFIDKRENCSNRVFSNLQRSTKETARYWLCSIYKRHTSSWRYSWSKQSPWNCTVCNRKTLQQLLQILIPEVEFHRPPKVTESDRLSTKKTHDAAIHEVEAKGILAIQNKWNYCLKLHSCYERQSIAARNECFQWFASTSFLSVSRSLFAPDGKMLHCSAKSALMKLLETFSAWWWIRAKNDHWPSD